MMAKGFIDDGNDNEGVYDYEDAADRRRFEKIARFEGMSESEVKERWARSRHGEPGRFETRKGDDFKRKRQMGSERGIARSRLRAVGIERYLVRLRELKSEVRQRWGRSEMNRHEERRRFETLWRGGERAAALMKMRRMENYVGIELNDDSFRKRKSEVEQRWDKTRCAECPTRFETLIEAAHRRQQKKGCESGDAQITLRKMEHAMRIKRNLERLGELKREVWDSWEKNRAEKTRFETPKGDDIRRERQRDSERGVARIKLRKTDIAAGIDRNVERFGELERVIRERQDSWQKNHAEKPHFEAQKGDDIRRKQKRESDKAAELIKLQKMENTVKIDRNHESFRELEYLSGCTLSFTVLESQVVTGVYQGSRFWNPLAELGLKLKDECYLDEDDDAVFEKDESHLEESYSDSDVIVEEKCKNSPDDSMPSDDKALRAATLKGRYSEIILKAQKKTLFN